MLQLPTVFGLNDSAKFPISFNNAASNPHPRSHPRCLNCLSSLVETYAYACSEGDVAWNCDTVYVLYELVWIFEEGIARMGQTAVYGNVWIHNGDCQID